MSQLLGRTFATWFAEAPRLLALSLATSAPMALTVYTAFKHVEWAAPSQGLLLLLVPFLYLALKPIERGAASVLVVRRLAGERAELGAALAAGLRSLGRVLGVQLLLLAALLPGLVLVVPGLAIMAGWQVAAPAAALEGLRPAAALRRSWSLTAGCRWRLLAGLTVIYAILAVILVAEMLTIGALVPDSGVTTPLFDGVATAALVVIPGLVGTLPRVASAVAYHGLCAVNEDCEALASVFA